MFGHRIKIDDELFSKLEKCAAAEGYSSVEELVTHLLERETMRLLNPREPGESEEEVRKRLQGLGYIE